MIHLPSRTASGRVSRRGSAERAGLELECHLLLLRARHRILPPPLPPPPRNSGCCSPQERTASAAGCGCKGDRAGTKKANQLFSTTTLPSSCVVSCWPRECLGTRLGTCSSSLCYSSPCPGCDTPVCATEKQLCHCPIAKLELQT